jgi:outer membrane protein assembly factor BamB
MRRTEPLVNRTRLLGVVVAATASLSTLVAPSARADAVCTPTETSADWTTFGHDLSNSRTALPDAAGDIGTTTVPLLTKRWAFTTGTAFGGLADLNGTPIVAGDCLYIGDAAGFLYALSLADGSVVWKVDRSTPIDETGLGSGLFIGSPVVDHGVLYALASKANAPYLLAVDAATGDVLGEQTIVDDPQPDNGYYTQATPVIVGDVLLAGFSPAEGDATKRGGVALFDLNRRPGNPHDAHASDVPTWTPSSGNPMPEWTRTIMWTIPDDDFNNPPHYAGGGIWAAPAVDPTTGYAYVGTSNPYSKRVEHRYTNAIIKFGVDPTRTDYATIVASYKGLIDQYDETLKTASQPTCDAVGEEEALQEPVVGDSTPCAQLDLDFGASPNLFHDSAGQLLVGDLQKSGWYHAADAATMAPAWKMPVGGTCPLCNASASAIDGGAVIGTSAPGSVEFSISADDGTPRWDSPIGDGAHYESTSIANGVVFTVSNAGDLLAWDEATGVPLVHRPVQVDLPDGGTAAALSSSGIAIAHGLILVAAGNSIVAYSV